MTTPLDPKTPREYLEACRRIVDTLERMWDELSDGDGDEGSPDNETQTKTDMFIILAGCAELGKEAIKTMNELALLVDGGD